jgi:hypothetical protein
VTVGPAHERVVRRAVHPEGAARRWSSSSQHVSGAHLSSAQLSGAAGDRPGWAAAIGAGRSLRLAATAASGIRRLPCCAHVAPLFCSGGKGQQVDGLDQLAHNRPLRISGVRGMKVARMADAICNQPYAQRQCRRARR